MVMTFGSLGMPASLKYKFCLTINIFTGRSNLKKVLMTFIATIAVMVSVSGQMPVEKPII